jgi:hypothetical protein
LQLGHNRPITPLSPYVARLAEAVSAEATTFAVDDAASLANFLVPFDIRIGAEQMTVTAVDAVNNLVTAARGRYGSAAEDHVVGAQAVALMWGGVSLAEEWVVASLTVDMDPYGNLLPVNGAAILERLPLPFDVIVDSETMTVIEIEPISHFVRVARGAGAMFHEAETPVRVFVSGHRSPVAELSEGIGATQQVVPVTDTTGLAQYTLPFGIVVGREEMTVTAIDADENLLHVERGTNGTLAVAHNLLVDPDADPNVYLADHRNRAQLHVLDAAPYARYSVPFDIAVEEEMMTVTEVRGDVRWSSGISRGGLRRGTRMRPRSKASVVP